MCGNAGTTRQDYAHQAAVLDRVYVAASGVLEDGSRFRIFGNKASQYAISMKEQPTLCFVATSIFS